VHIGEYRSVYNIPHARTVGSFVDELAAAAGKDPLQYKLAMLGSPRKLDPLVFGPRYGNYGASLEQYIDVGRLRNVVRVAAARSGWVRCSLREFPALCCGGRACCGGRLWQRDRPAHRPRGRLWVVNPDRVIRRCRDHEPRKRIAQQSDVQGWSRPTERFRPLPGAADGCHAGDARLHRAQRRASGRCWRTRCAASICGHRQRHLQCSRTARCALPVDPTQLKSA
jgi:hypothetical protein